MAQTKTIEDVQAQPDFQSRLDSFTTPPGPPQSSATPLPLAESSLAVVATLHTTRGESPEHRSGGAGGILPADRAGLAGAAEAGVRPPGLAADAGETPDRDLATAGERPTAVPKSPPADRTPAPVVVPPGQAPPMASPASPRPAPFLLPPPPPVGDPARGPAPGGQGRAAAPVAGPTAAEPAAGDSVELPGPASVRDAVFSAPQDGQSAPAPPNRVPPAARVASEFVLAALFAAGVTHPWWTAGLFELNRVPGRGRRPATEE
jgi:hypothetical protein